MSKKAKKQNKNPKINELSDKILPRNILPVGERVEENKNIYISQPVYKEIHRFTKNKTVNESGGMLIGTVIEEFGKTNIVISGFVEAKFCEATPTTLKFTHDTWDYVHRETEKKHKGKKIVGWIHTHPDFGIFLSEYDKFIHQNFFSEDYHIAYVVDPIQNIEGFYFWINGNIEKCKGFYIYDKTGTQITVDVAKDEPKTEKSEGSTFGMKNILIAILPLAVVLLAFSNISTNKRLKAIEKEQEKLENQQMILVNSANQALFEMQQKIENLKNILKEAGIIIEPEKPADPDEGDDSTDAGTGDTEQGDSGTEEGGTESNE